ncbi:MAG: hypothetical protein IKX21_02475, partial [Deltaproteobacteria bacterium]|nr:hypothetical protein [Deltaproteobacteria bacterium]
MFLNITRPTQTLNSRLRSLYRGFKRRCRSKLGTERISSGIFALSKHTMDKDTSPVCYVPVVCIVTIYESTEGSSSGCTISGM